jgi:hypothetical protein
MLCHPCPPRIFFQEHNPHCTIKADGLATEQNTTAQWNTVGHKKDFNETTYNSSPKGVEEAQQSANCMKVDSHKSVGLR